MFALEIAFQDGVSQPEMIFIRRPQALIGATEQAHVVVDDMKQLDYQIRLVRDLGRTFRCNLVGGQGGTQVSGISRGFYDNEGQLNTGPVRLTITALDSDLLLREGEPPDRAGVRVLRASAAYSKPIYPAMVVRGQSPMVISFSHESPVYVGRSKQCEVRLESPDISARHARLGFEADQFWIEDLGSTNGTFINEQQISGRVTVPLGASIILGRETSIVGVRNEEELLEATRAAGDLPEMRGGATKYPILFSVSGVARPAKIALRVGDTVVLGRDPGSDMWLGAPHVSRRHCSVLVRAANELVVMDHSTNGTGYEDGILRNNDELILKSEPRVLNFGGEVTVSLCFSEAQEKSFIASGGAADTFASGKVNNSPVEVESTGLIRPAPQGGAGAPLGRDLTAGADLGPGPGLWGMFESLSAFGKIGAVAVVILLVALLTLVILLLGTLI